MRHDANPWTYGWDYFDLFGAEGEGDGSGTPPTVTNSTITTTTTNPPGGDGGDDGDDSERTYSAGYVKNLRSEAAQHRTKAKEYEAELEKYRAAEAERQKAEMTEVERFKAEAEEQKSALEAAQAALISERVTNAVFRAASGLNFQDPGDALSFLDDTEIEFTDGIPSEKSITKLLTDLAKTKPYLLKTAGSGDGGARGTAPKPESFEERQKAHLNDLLNQGQVRIG